MLSKECKCCSNIFPLDSSNFHKNKNSKDTFSLYCKKCANEKRRNYVERNRKKVNESLRKSYSKYREQRLENKRKYYIENKDRIDSYKKSDHYRELSKSRRKLSHNRTKRSTYRRNRTKNDPLYKVKENIRCSILSHVKKRGSYRKSKTCEVLGCSYDYFINHLKKTFEDNYKIPWIDDYLPIVQIDHVIPMSEATNIESVYQLNYYTNLQFLYKKDNLLKSNKIDWTLDLTKTELYDNINLLENTAR